MKMIQTAILLAGILTMGPGRYGLRLGVLIEDPGLAREVGLSPSQLDSLRDLFYSTEEEIVALRGQLELQRLKLRRIMESKDPDEKEALRIADKIEKIKGEIRKKGLERTLMARRVMTEEQWMKWQEIARYRKTARRHRRMMRENPPPPAGPDGRTFRRF